MSAPFNARRFWTLGVAALGLIAVLGAMAAVSTENQYWAIGAAGLGTIVLFVLIAIAKRREGP